MKMAIGMVLVSLACALLTHGTEDIEQHRLYTQPDPKASGGVTGRIVSPAGPIRQILAIPRTSQNKAYRGTLDHTHRHFRFEGLPMDHYDLIVFFENHVYEGIRLSREPDSLTPSDKTQIAGIIDRSEPFFSRKQIHRVAGQTGRGSEAMAFVTFARERMSEMYAGPVIRSGLRRTHKLVFLRQVGPGWQIARTRDLYPIWVENPAHLRPIHTYAPDLAGFRVTTSIRNIGELAL